VDVAKNYRSPLTGQPALVVAVGGVNGGRSLAASLVLGTSVVWVGIWFVASLESAVSKINIEAVVSARFGDIVTGRPLHVLSNDYIREWG
jgi:NAD(P)H-dependent flavin oxidoreductase YrpB (nitropropane dioxygenase family)